jgi:hypothetical protein
MDEQHTQAPWSSDVEGILYAVNGRPGQTTVATVSPGAPAALLAAAPDLLWALADSMELLEQEFEGLPSGARLLAVLDARNSAKTALGHATIGYAGSTARVRSWKVNPTLPEDEQKANERLLDAAAELHEAVQKTYAVLAGHVNNPEVVGALQKALARLAR